MKRVPIAGLIAIIFVLGFVCTAGAVSIGFGPSLSQVPIGQNFSVDIVVSDFASADLGVGAWDLDFTFDPGLLSFMDLQFGTLVNPSGFDQQFPAHPLT
jgi:hypothetical protein